LFPREWETERKALCSHIPWGSPASELIVN
jgi:hypothetical protein